MQGDAGFQRLVWSKVQSTAGCYTAMTMICQFTILLQIMTSGKMGIIKVLFSLGKGVTITLNSLSGDFLSFVILTKSCNPVPQDFIFSEPSKDDIWNTPRSRFGSLRRSISRQSLRYRSQTLQRSSGRFSSMFSLRHQSTKLSRKNVRPPGNNKSFDSIDKIDEDENNDATLDSDNSRIGVNMQDSSFDASYEKENGDTNNQITSAPTKFKRSRRFNPFDDGLDERINNNGDHYNHANGCLNKSDSLLISEAIISEILKAVVGEDIAIPFKYDDRKNPFIDEL